MVSLDHLTPAECIRLEYYFRYKRLLKDGYCESPCISNIHLFIYIIFFCNF